MDLFRPTGDWTPAEMEQAGHAVLQLIRRHLAELEETPVLPDIGADELRRLLDDPVPAEPERFQDIVEDTRERIIPHLTLWNHPRFFAYFPVGSSGPGALADLLASTLNINGMLWKTAPAASALEQLVLRWMAEMVGYDIDADGVLINGASLATFYALAAAREAAGLDIRQQGLTGRALPRLRVYCSEHVHSSIDKAIIGLGLGLDNLVKLETDASHRLDPERLAQAVRVDVEAGYRPLAVVAVVGTTSTGAVDPVEDVAAVCREYDMWLHVDAAYGGFYNIVPTVREQVGGLHAADSIVVNPHKVLFTPLEVTALYCRRKGALPDAFTLIPEYLRTDDSEGVVNPMDFTLQLGRGFRSLKVWWVIRAFGLEGLRARMEHQLRLAQQLRARIEADPDFETFDAMTADVRGASGGMEKPFSPYPLVCFRAFPQAWREWREHGSDRGGDPESGAQPGAQADPESGANIDGEFRAHAGSEFSADAESNPEAGVGAVESLSAAVDRFNDALLQRVNAGRHHFISHTVVREGYILRAAIGNLRTDEEHIESLWRVLKQSLGELSFKLEDWL